VLFSVAKINHSAGLETWLPPGSRQAADCQARLCAAAALRVVERSFAWMARFRRLALDYECLAETLAGLHFIAFAMLMAHRFVSFMTQSALQVLVRRRCAGC